MSPHLEAFRVEVPKVRTIPKNMSKKIGVLDCHQFACDSPARYVPKSVASMLVQRNQAEKIADMIRMFPVQSSAKKAADFRAIQTYIPQVMPPINVPNTFFQLPQSPQWKLQHRNFEQMVASLAQ